MEYLHINLFLRVLKYHSDLAVAISVETPLKTKFGINLIQVDLATVLMTASRPMLALFPTTDMKFLCPALPNVLF